MPFVFERPWLLWLFLPFVWATAVAKRDESGFGPRWLSELAEENPWLKWWAVACGFAYLGATIFVIGTHYEFDERFLPAVLILAFGLILGPFFAVHEYRRFHEYAE